MVDQPGLPTTPNNMLTFLLFLAVKKIYRQHFKKATLLNKNLSHEA